MATMARQSSLLERAQSGAMQNRLVWGLLALATVLTVLSIMTQVRGECSRHCAKFIFAAVCALHCSQSAVRVQSRSALHQQLPRKVRVCEAAPAGVWWLRILAEARCSRRRLPGARADAPSAADRCCCTVVVDSPGVRAQQCAAVVAAQLLVSVIINNVAGSVPCV